MNDNDISCPRCGHVFPLDAALAARIEARFAAEEKSRIEAAVREAEARARGELAAHTAALQKLLEEQTARAREAEARELGERQRAQELEQARQQAVERARLEVEERLRREAQERIAQAEERARAQLAPELELLRQQLHNQERKTLEAQQRELELTRQAEELRLRQRELDLELERRLAAARAEDERRLRELLAQEHGLKLAERDKQIADLRRLIEEMKQKSEQGSQELQGEVLELDLQAALERQFPHDLITPVPKGAAGADLLQTVRNGQGGDCGLIVWETKNTRHWSHGWLAKLRDDTRAAGGDLCVLVSAALPEGVGEFALLEGVWVASRRVWPALAVALREQLMQVAFARAAASGENEKMALVYRYLTSEQFRHKIEAIVEAFSAMQGQLAAERRAMERIWKEREKQIERVIRNTAGMYGELRGIAGAGLPEVKGMSLDAVTLLPGAETADPQ